jgi:ribosomal protein S7
VTVSSRWHPVSLFDQDPDLVAGVPEEDRAIARRTLIVPAVALDTGLWSPPDDLPFALLIGSRAAPGDALVFASGYNIAFGFIEPPPRRHVCFYPMNKSRGEHKNWYVESMEDRARQDSLKLFKSAVDNCKPAVEVKSRRVGGSTYQVPVEVRPDRRTALSMRWLIGAARRRSERSMSDKLAGELLDAANNRGTAVKKREDTHKMAEANKAFAHYRW